MSVETSAYDAATMEVIDRNIKLSFDFARQILADPAILDDIPDGVTLVLLLKDDPAFNEINIDLGLKALRRGEDAYFRYMRDRPASADESGAASDRPSG